MSFGPRFPIEIPNDERITWEGDQKMDADHGTTETHRGLKKKSELATGIGGQPISDLWTFREA